MPDRDTNRPLVGFVVFNEHYISYDDGNFRGQISNFVHELLHALYFQANLFKLFPPNENGESFVFQDSSDNWKLRGTHVLRHLRSHFDCPDIDGGMGLGLKCNR